MNRLIFPSTRRLASQYGRNQIPRISTCNAGSNKNIKGSRQNLFFSTTTAPNDSRTQQNQSASTNLSELRTKILEKALIEVHHHGWTDDALAAASMSVKKNSSSTASMSVVGMMTVDDLIAFCMDEMNRQLRLDLMERNLKQQRRESNSNASTTTTTTNQSHYARLNATTSHNNNGTDPLEEGIRMRLEYLIPYLKSGRWHEGMALGVRGPANALQTQKQLQEMIECIVDHNTNIKSLQYSTPTKMALGAVYVATELHLLSDTSPGYHDTWAFLSSRMDDWRRLIAMTGDSPDGGFGNSSSSGLPAPSDALFVVSSVASSLMGGALSLVMNNNSISSAMNNKNGVFGLPHEVLVALFQANQSGWGSSSSGSGSSNVNSTTAPTSTMDGTQPSHYDAPKKAL